MTRELKFFSGLLVVTLLLLFLACCSGGSDLESGTIRVTFIDVGKGDCILIEKDNSAVMIDCGYKNTFSAVSSVLNDRGIKSLDYLIITHYDKDHVGGAAQIANAYEIGQIYLPDYIPSDNSNYENLTSVITEKSLSAARVSEDLSFVLADVTYNIYATTIAYEEDTDSGEGNDNNVSLVITAEYGDDSYLFPGDIEKKGIKAYLAANHGSFDVVKMPHHGSLEDNSDQFIADTAVKIALITDSSDDLAEDGLLQLLTDAGVTVYRSSSNGTITVTSTGTGEYRVTTEK